MFKKFALSAAVVVCAGGLALSATAGNAEAGNGWQPGVAAAGGFVAGALVGSALAQPRYAPPPPPHYYHPGPPVYYRPAPRPVSYRPVPWSPEWYRYCSARYRSFDPATGYFRTYSGQARFCR